MAMFRRAQPSVEPEPPINADELRKRLLGARALDVDDQSNKLLGPEEVSAAPEPQPNHQQNGNGAIASKPASKQQEPDDSTATKNSSQSDPGTKANTINGGNPMSQTDLPGGPAEVAKTFEPSKIFQDRLSKLSPAFDQVDRLGKEATAALARVTELANHLEKFAAAYAPVRTFQSEVTVLAEKFDPLKSIQNQLAEMSRSFCDHLNYLVAVMEPARKMRQRLAEFAMAFEPVDDLQERFKQLAHEFEGMSGPAPSANGKIEKGQEASAH